MNEISSDPLNEAQVYSILNNLIISNCHDTCPQCLLIQTNLILIYLPHEN